MRQIRYIVIHCAATFPHQDIGATEIRRWHIDGNKWSDIGYHYVIRRNGQVEPGRGHETVGAHVRGHNENSIGICLVGGLDPGVIPSANYTDEQWAALEFLVKGLTKQYPGAVVKGHRDFGAAVECPCFDAIEWWDEVQMSDMAVEANIGHSADPLADFEKAMSVAVTRLRAELESK